MGVTICPAAVVAAPVDTIWELLSDPTTYDAWWDARAERIVPEGKAAPGQVVYAKTSAFGRTWEVTLKVEAVRPEQHQIQLRVALPLGIVNNATISAAPIDATSARLQFG